MCPKLRPDQSSYTLWWAFKWKSAAAETSWRWQKEFPMPTNWPLAAAKKWILKGFLCNFCWHRRATTIFALISSLDGVFALSRGLRTLDRLKSPAKEGKIVIFLLHCFMARTVNRQTFWRLFKSVTSVSHLYAAHKFFCPTHGKEIFLWCLVDDDGRSRLDDRKAAATRRIVGHRSSHKLNRKLSRAIKADTSHDGGRRWVPGRIESSDDESRLNFRFWRKYYVQSHNQSWFATSCWLTDRWSRFSSNCFFRFFFLKRSWRNFIYARITRKKTLQSQEANNILSLSAISEVELVIKFQPKTNSSSTQFRILHRLDLFRLFWLSANSRRLWLGQTSIHLDLSAIIRHRHS